MSDIAEAKRRLPLPRLMAELGLGEYAKQSAKCPLHDDKRNSFSVFTKHDKWAWNCFSNCGGGDEITFLEKFKGLTNKQAIKEFLHMAGCNGTTPVEPEPPIPHVVVVPIDWETACNIYGGQGYAEKLAGARGYALELCQWLGQQQLIGVIDGQVAFPVSDEQGKVVAAHVRTPDGRWRYTPKGAKVTPFVIGKLEGNVHVFESQWDMFAFMDASGERASLVCTRGKGNGKLAVSLLPENKTIFVPTLTVTFKDTHQKHDAYLWTQNDAPGQEWQDDIRASYTGILKRCQVPLPHKDLNAWRQAGATDGDVFNAMLDAKEITLGSGLSGGSNEVAAAIQSQPPPQTSLADTLTSVAAFLSRYIAFPLQEQAAACALWAAHTWVYSAFAYTPYLHICSPEKRCGKTRLLDCLELLVRKPWRTITPSEAVLFREIERDKPTLFLDEVDAVFSKQDQDRNEHLRALLNAGFESGAKIPRCEGRSFAVKEFAVFCPKAISGIGNIPDTIHDRCIDIRLIRQTGKEKAERFRKLEAIAEATSARGALEAWSSSSTIVTLAAARPSLPEELTDRQQDICEPLLAIADMAGNEWGDKARHALVTICSTTDDLSLGINLLASIRTIFLNRDTDKLTSTELLKDLVSVESADAIWVQWWADSVTREKFQAPAMRLASLLAPYGIHPATIRMPEDKVGRGYYKSDFRDAFSRYLPAPPVAETLEMFK